MTIYEALLLGLVQGLTEFLPVSSSGHLVIFQHLFGFTQPPIAFDVLVHVATLMVTVAVFRKEIMNLDRTTLKAIAWGLLPTGIIGLLLNRYSEELFSSLTITAFSFLITTLILISSKFIKVKEKQQKVSTGTAILVGIAQGIAVIPAISRSAATVVSGLWLGLDQVTAVSFSFLLSIPAIAGAQLVELPNLLNNPDISPTAYSLGFISAFVSGWLSLGWLKLLVQKSKLHFFAIYTFFLALIIFFS